VDGRTASLFPFLSPIPLVEGGNILLQIEINTQAPLDRVLGGKSVSIDLPSPASVADLMAYLKQQYPDFETRFQAGGDEHGTAFNFFLNRKALREQDLASTPLKEGDRIHIIVPVVGGR
jgi:molybdopterin converting factor small subunit